jgi:Xaa-Pro aminopeptidase
MNDMSARKAAKARLLYARGADVPDIRYATGFSAPDPFLLLARGGEKHLLVSPLEAARAGAACPNAVLWTREILVKDAGAGAGGMPASLLWMRRLGVRSVEVSPGFPVGVARELEAGGVGVRVARGAAFPERAVKREDELDCIGAAQRAAVRAFRLAAGAMRRSRVGKGGRLELEGRALTSERLKGIIEDELRRLGYDAADGLIVAVGEQAARPHDEGSGVIREGQPVVMDIFPQSRKNGYWGDFTRTVAKGRIPDWLRRMHAAVEGAQRLALGMVRPGVKGSEVQRAVEKFFEGQGYETKLEPPGEERGFIHSLGHGVGLEIHEEPRLSRKGGVLRAGNVVTVEPGLYVPGQGGVRIEDTVAVTENGCRLFADCGRGLDGR